MTTLDIFYSYAHEDEPLRDELAGHLRILERRGVIRSWADRDIVPGQDWSREIATALESADLVLLLVSSDFINSDYIWGVELATAMRRHREGEAKVIPVMIRACDIEGAPFSSLQGLPTDLRAVTSWPNRDEAWTDVAKGIRRASTALQANITPPAASAPGSRSKSTSGMFSMLRNAFERFGGVLTRGAGTGPTRSSGPEPALPGNASNGQSTITLPDSGRGGATPDEALTKVLNNSVARMAAAAEARGVTIQPEVARSTALDLVDTPSQKRILWVDDRPGNNSREMAVLAGLQIEVVTAKSTEAAMKTIDGDNEPFDLVLSDWWRGGETLNGAPSAAVALLRALRSREIDLPVLLYHGTFDAREREALRRVALAEHALGEANQPDELFKLIASQFGGAGNVGERDS